MKTLIEVFEERLKLCSHALYCGETYQRHKDANDVDRAIKLLKFLEKVNEPK